MKNKISFVLDMSTCYLYIFYSKLFFISKMGILG